VLLDRVVAVVNKEVITWSELYKMMEYDAAEQVKSLHTEERLKVFKESEAVYLEKLIDMKLQVQEAKRIGLDVGKEEVNEAIENIKKKYSLTGVALEESLKKEGLTFEEYKERLSEQIVVGKIVNQQIRNKIVVSDEEVNKHIQSNKDRFDDSEAFRLRQIFFKKPRQDEEKKATEDRADMIMQRLRAGEDFSTLAGEFSEDSSGRIGGDIGIVKKSYMAKEFVEVLASMKEGEYSTPFWTEKGLHIIKLDEKVSSRTSEEQKEEIRKQLIERQFIEMYEGWIKGLREKARISIYL
jgi:peptidyl-prolyl cis-trans isomerase SurA